jgi:isopenicillin-N epimerase
VAVLVDGAHVPGMLPVEVDRIGADFWVGNFHKWAYAPRGTALLAVAPPWRDRIRPVVVSGQHDLGFPANLEWLGARDYTPWLAAPTALFTLRTLGVARVLEHNARLAGHAQRVVATALGVTAPPAAGGLAMRVVPLPAGHATDAESAGALRRRIADELAAEVAVVSWKGRGLLRLSAQIYNHPDEYDRLAAGLRRLL